MAAATVAQLPTEVKVAAAVVAVAAVAGTPRGVYWPYALYALAIAAVWAAAGVSPRWVLPRMVIELPFVVLAVLLPFGGGDPRVPVAGVSLSVDGLHAAGAILAKGTVGVAVSLTLAATTDVRALPEGLARLKVPPVFVVVASLMVRYLDVLVGEARRMRVARLSRGDDPRTLRQAGATARGVGTLFLRSYERGERVHVAMLARGYTGADLAVGAGLRPPATRRQWLVGLAPAAAFTAVCVLAWASVVAR